MWLLLLLACWSQAGGTAAAVIDGPGGGARLTLWTPGHLEPLHAALRSGAPLRAELRPVRPAREARGPGPGQGPGPGPAKLSLWVPRGQEQAAAHQWTDEASPDALSPVVVREADEDDGYLDEEEQPALMSTAWLRQQRGSAGPPRVRRRRSAATGAAKTSSEDVEKAAQTPQQVKAARSHQFITTRNEKDQPPVVREVEPVTEKPPEQSVVHTSPVAAGSSRIGAGRDALGLRTNEIPQGPRYASVYESESSRHASDHRQYTADSYGSHNAYSASMGGAYGNYGYPNYGASPSYASPSYVPYSNAVAGRNNQGSATPRRIIYYASLPDPAPQPPPGASRVPHEYRGPPFDANGAYSADARYPAAPAAAPYYDGRSPLDNNPYRSRYRPEHAPRYTIIDAEPPPPVLGAYRSTVAPSPFRDRPASPSPASFPQPYRISPPPTTDAGPQAAAPIQYTQYDYNGIAGLPPHLPSDPMSPSGARTANTAALVETKPGGVQVPLSDDPYRGFNPRQPAPWSMQVGTRLTVKDDGYGGVGGGSLPPAARRFYVTSQQSQPPGAVPAPRFPRPLDRSEARHRLFR